MIDSQISKIPTFQKLCRNAPVQKFLKEQLCLCTRMWNPIFEALKNIAMNWTAFFVAPARPLGAILSKQLVAEFAGCRRAIVKLSPLLPKSWHLNLKQKLHSIEKSQAIALKRLEEGWKVEEIALEVEGRSLDVRLLTHSGHLPNRWMLYSGGNAECMDIHLSAQFQQFSAVLQNAQTLRTQIALFNYPGVGRSEGQLNRQSMVRSTQAVLRFLENRMAGSPWAQLIGYGWSMGGAVQAEAFQHHKKHPDIRYALIKDRTFSQLSPVVEQLLGPLCAWLLKLSGWNFSTVDKVLKSEFPECILQSRDDEIISDSSSLAKALESRSDSTSWKGHVIWARGRHFGPPTPRQRDDLVNWVEEQLGKTAAR